MQMRAQGPLCRFCAEGGLRSHASAHERASLPLRARFISATTALATGQCQKQCEWAADEDDGCGQRAWCGHPTTRAGLSEGVG